MTEANNKRTDGPQQSPLSVGLVWDGDGDLKPPYTERHQRLHDEMMAAKANYDNAEPGDRHREFTLYMAAHRVLVQAMNKTVAAHKRAKINTVKHRDLAIRVAAAEKQWRKTNSGPDLRVWIDLDEELEYAVMDEMEETV